MKARFVCQPSRGESWEFRLPRLPAQLGRGEQADVRLDDHWVSRQHCQFEQRQGALIVKDLGSRHGTWLNDQRVDEAEIHAGDRLGIGLTTLIAKPPCAARELGPCSLFFGHVVASLLGLAFGYYILCWLRPAEFNWWHLPVPGSSSVMLDAVPAASQSKP